MISITAARVWFYFLSLFYLVSNAAFLWFKPEYRTPWWLGAMTIFFFVYLLPLTLFEAKIEPKPDGLHILQYRSLVVPYADVKICFGFLLIPFRRVVVVTNRKLPVKVLLTIDDADGKLVKAVKGFMAAERLNLRPQSR